MKKYIIFILFLFIPFVVNAEINYDITDYYVSSEVEIAGGIKIKELLVLNGTFNGYQRDLVYQNSSLPKWEAGNINFEKSSIYAGSSIEKLKVSMFKVRNSVNFDTMDDIAEYSSEATKATLGDKDVYTIEDTVDGKNVKMYMPANNEKIAFYLEYVVTNAVVIHNDVAELYFPYIGDKFSDKIENVKLRVFIPTPDSSKYFKIWAHGPLNGTLDIYKNENNENIGLLATTSNLSANTGFDIRMTFDKSIIDIQEFLNHSNQDAFDEILKVEENRMNDANKKRSKIKRLYNFLYVSAIAYLVALIGAWIYIYVKFDKEYKSDFKGKYYREFIDDYDVEVIDYLFHKCITPNAMSASIMNMVYKKNIEVEEIPSDKKKKDYLFKLINRNNLSDAETYLVDFLFDTVGENNVFTTNQLKKYASSSSYSVFNTKYSTWKNKVEQEGMKQQFFEKPISINIFGIIYAIIGVIIFYTNCKLNTDIFIGYIVIAPAIIFGLYCIAFNKRSKNGNEHYNKWKAFKNFLNDFSTFETKDLPQIVLWERYMVYAVIFGIADKVQKAMNVKINEFDNTMSSPYINTWLFYDMNSSITNSITTAVSTSVNSAIAKSAASTNGSGGGFSSGAGGGFGGGGGGHGF